MNPQQQLESYEPAERDPVAIRRTVVTLVLLMLVGGFFIVYKYKQKMGEEHELDKKGRPAFSLGQVSTKTNIQLLSTDDGVKDFTLLEGKLTLISVISAKLPDESKLIVNEMKKAQEHFADKERLQLVCVSADSLADVSQEELIEFSDEIGASGEDWLILASDSEALVGYVKDVLKLGMVSRVSKDSNERILPDLLRIIDPSTSIRGGIGDFTFVEYHRDKARAKDIIQSDAGEIEKKQAQEVYDNIITYQRNRMYKNIDYILTYESTDVEALRKENRSNRYNTPLIVFTGFILFILIMGYRLKMQRNKESLVNKE